MPRERPQNFQLKKQRLLSKLTVLRINYENFTQFFNEYFNEFKVLHSAFFKSKMIL